MTRIYLDGSLVNTQDDLHSQLALVMEFPADYGKNLDALWDCLGDYAISLQGKLFELVIKNSAHVQNVVGSEYLEKVVACFVEARDEFKARISIALE